MRLRERCLIVGLALTVAPHHDRRHRTAGGGRLDYAGGATVCAQGEVRGADGVPRAATPVVPYPCEYDWYCGTDIDLDVGWDPGRPGIAAPVASDHVVEQLPHNPSTPR